MKTGQENSALPNQAELTPWEAKTEAADSEAETSARKLLTEQIRSPISNSMTNFGRSSSRNQRLHFCLQWIYLGESSIVLVQSCVCF